MNSRTPWTPIVALLCALAGEALAEEHVIRMLNNGAGGSMVFEPDFVKAGVGDTLRFEPTHRGHQVRSLAVPEGATAWESSLDATYVVELTHEGLYPYVCPPHLMNAMFGIVQVGRADNLAPALKAIDGAKRRMFLDPGRVDAVVGRIER